MSDAAPLTELHARVRSVTQQALASGALGPIDTRVEALDDCGLTFQVRVVESLARKRVAAATAPRGANPFLPHEDAMFVAEVSATHLALLNKFPVIDDHLLLVTRAFESQLAPLTVDDFGALVACMEHFDGLGFYNAGVQFNDGNTVTPDTAAGCA